MGMKGQKIAIIAGAVLASCLCLGGAWMVWRAFSQAGDVRKTLEDSLGQLQKVYAKDPFPSRNNVAAITNDTHRLREWNAALSRDLSTNESVAATNALTPSAFIQQLQHTVRELDAVAARNGGKVLADGFAYGFPQYLGAAGGMPKPEDVKRLDVQLRMVDAIMREMLAGHVSAISLAEREVFETGVEAVAPGAASVSRRGSRRAAPRAAMTAAAPAAMGAYPHQHFVFAFDVAEYAFDDVLDRLAVMPMFVVVTELTVQRDERGLRAPSDTTAAAGVAPAAKPAESADSNKTKAPALPRSQREASGPDIAPLLKVRMQLDVYTFEGV